MTLVVPTFANDDERNMTNGDESDDEDLTDADSMQSSWSDGEFHVRLACNIFDPKTFQQILPAPC
jgi:hypothetical protein